MREGLGVVVSVRGTVLSKELKPMTQKAYRENQCKAAITGFTACLHNKLARLDRRYGGVEKGTCRLIWLLKTLWA